MSELKVINAYLPTFDADHNEMLLVSHTKENYVSAKQIECYLKDEADEVIAELKAENKSLLQQNHELCQALQVMYSQEEYDKQKYKRCMAMAHAEWLKQMVLCNYPESILYRRAVRRERKWKEMAQNFKEAK